MKTKLLLLFFLLAYNQVIGQNCIGTAGQLKWNYWTGFRVTPDSSALFSLEFFPNNPDGSQIIASTHSPLNFTDYYAGQMRGFIKVPQTDTYVFNLTGDDRALFYLSTNHLPQNKKLRATVPSFTDRTEHQKFPEQTSVPITLQGGQYYYFEVYNFEGGWTDFVTLFWRKQNQSTWSIIDFNFLWEYGCETTCPPRGTACNDGNPLTTNDVQDGFCNCVGTAPTTNTCVGERGKLDAYYYDDINGSYVENDLINAPKFPLLPDRRENLLGIFGPLSQSSKDQYGTLIQGFLTVPISGQYQFNLTGDNQTFFFLSKNDSIEYKQNHQAIVIGGVGEFDHRNSVFQNVGPVFLEKNKYYYFEIRHKENNWRDHFHLFWKTPFHAQNTWKKIPDFYIFDYNCEIACIAANTPCDDNDPYTNNDKINNQCECEGTPCTGPDCIDPEASYQFFADCDATDNLNPSLDASWVSCSTSPNPNTNRGTGNHWIKYDFDDIHKFSNTRVWNYNVTGQTNRGFNQVVIDYSLDGTSWTQLGGVYNWPQAPGIKDYSGFVGPNFNDLKAKHVLITALNNHGAVGCSGFSKITFDALICNPKDTPCDDGDPLTSYDKFDENCNCRGIDINCANDTLLLSAITLNSAEFKALKNIESISKVPNTQNISFTAGNSIVLLPGFEVKTDAVFSASIEGCIKTQFMANEAQSFISQGNHLISEENSGEKLKEIVFRLNEPGNVELVLKDSSGNKIVEILKGFQQNLGTQKKFIPTTLLKKGKYEVSLNINGNEVKEFFEVK
jgi:hypothetical protein